MRNENDYSEMTSVEWITSIAKQMEARLTAANTELNTARNSMEKRIAELEAENAKLRRSRERLCSLAQEAHERFRLLMEECGRLARLAKGREVGDE